MNKIVTGPEAAHVIDINASTADNIKAVAKAKNLAISDQSNE
jgi:fructose-1,6-bisphosphatase II